MMDLSNIRGVREYLASLLYRVEIDELEEAQATKRAYIAKIVLQALKFSEIEQRLIALEGAVNELKQNPEIRKDNIIPIDWENKTNKSDSN